MSKPTKSEGWVANSLTSDPKSWHNSSLVSVSQISSSGLRLLCSSAASMRALVRAEGGDDRLKHRILSTVFYEPSTRTSCSFQTAMLRLGGTFVHVDGGKGGNTSAAGKGESLDDTIACLQCYTDATVLRHPLKGSVPSVAAKSSKPVLSAGDGVGEHPTQALLDLFTIWDELGLGSDPPPSDEPIVIVLLGDLKHGRTVHSLAKLLSTSCTGRPVILRYCSPPSLKMPEYVKEYVANASTTDHVTQEETDDVQSALEDASVLYVTRLQKERFEDEEEYLSLKDSYIINQSLLSDAKAPSNMVIMHPLPRVNEISTDVDDDSRAAYFRQMENGMFVRMALLSLILLGQA
mmetsp:Transcript_33104/g.48342  ORF Transcript_33104/g.48342 Transcript_33104/m.48342 type:complete len:349 (-) Transcript_33104:157-1203(-)